MKKYQVMLAALYLLSSIIYCMSIQRMFSLMLQIMITIIILASYYKEIKNDTGSFKAGIGPFVVILTILQLIFTIF